MKIIPWGIVHSMGFTEIIELLPADVATSTASAAPIFTNTTPQKNPHIFLGIPCYACMMCNSFAASLISLQALCAQRGIQIYMDFVGNESLIERARNILVKRFLSNPSFTHMMFIDADIGFNPASVIRLLEFDKDVTSAVYPKKSINWELVKNKVAQGSPEDIRQMGLDFNINILTSDPPVNGFVKVLDVATGFLMMKREMLEKMYEHYKEELFAVNDIQGQNVENYIAIFACSIDKTTKRFLSEDYAFCRRYQEMGGEVWADISTPLSHTGTHVYSGNILERVTLG
jgi:hypothetical protein